MSNSNRVNRRQFVKSSVASAGFAALAATGSACPVYLDADGKRGDWWCIYDFDDSDPQIWIYYWKNCRTGATLASIGPPGMPIGKCANAPKDPGCVEAKVIFDWEKIDTEKMTFRIPSSLDAETRSAGLLLIAARTERL